MSQFEVGEVMEAVEPGRGGPPNMPHKHNPVVSMVAIAASQRVPRRVAALLAVMPQEHERAAGAWQAELAEWPQLVISTHGSARALAQVLPSLKVDARRMQMNLEAVRATLPKASADEWFAPSLLEPATQLALNQTAVLRDLFDAMKEEAPSHEGLGHTALSHQSLNRSHMSRP